MVIIAIVCASYTPPSNITAELIEHRLDGDDVFGWWSPVAPQSSVLLEELRRELKDEAAVDTAQYEGVWGDGVSKLSFGNAPAKRVAEMLYNATKVDGVWEKVPRKLWGVFWTKGNGIVEELTVLQYGTWFEEEQVYIAAMAPFSWAWAGGTPAQAPYDGSLYGSNVYSALSIVADGRPAASISVKCEPYPGGAECKPGSTDLSYGNLQFHMGSLSKSAGNMKTFFPHWPDFSEKVTGRYSLEQTSGPGQNLEFKRGCFWGLGTCHWIQFGSYNLKQIVDGDGVPVEPAYSEFMDYMGEIPLMVWSGFK
eukprot:CAMPEP_0177533886 /NCGR_PEP_ID=MMETSP0369-20130122/55591_1 /TAXON_ID=447022 ORGANISM="Scrippsiella hangoei-like, Strain SHHI-4" /NCGR_SAMPLE_ID=MMETSP0369 /ASSEMBLY_ACC=CAM_ASM_000364 /LENGTH=308 /DNA_ID=CAMNT_0019015677 /DNA_START=153 /DNA_END=1079 /DNA_ORIENTATION=+